MKTIEHAVDARSELGECPRWHPQEAALYFVDIARRELLRWRPGEASTWRRQFEEPVACFAFRRNGGLILGQASGFSLLDTLDGDVSPLEPQMLAGLPDNRLNDGRCDRFGRFWAGSMNTSKRKDDGALYRVDVDHHIERLFSGVLTANGIAFSPDGRRLYFADTPRHQLDVIALDASGSRLGPRRRLRDFPDGGGRPDGGSVDEEGCYWSALYDGGRVIRLSPDGEVLEQVHLPVRHCTMIAFGGEDRRRAFVTTARQGMSEDELERLPLCGGVFSFVVDVPGLPEPFFEG